MKLIHNVVACIIRHTVAQVFKIADLFQDSTIYNNFCPYGISSTKSHQLGLKLSLIHIFPKQVFEYRLVGQEMEDPGKMIRDSVKSEWTIAQAK